VKFIYLKKNSKVKCGVRQVGVLSHYLFSFYIDDIIAELRKSDHGIYVGRMFVGCVLLYADNNIILMSSCNGLQQMVNVCCQYGDWTTMGYSF